MIANDRIKALIDTINAMADGKSSDDVEGAICAFDDAKLDICVWCRENGAEYIKDIAEMSESYDPELGGGLCKACEKEADREAENE